MLAPTLDAGAPAAAPNDGGGAPRPEDDPRKVVSASAADGDDAPPRPKDGADHTRHKAVSFEPGPSPLATKRDLTSASTSSLSEMGSDEEGGGDRKRARVAAAPPGWLAGARPANLDEEVRLFAAWARPNVEERRARADVAARVGRVATRLWPRASCELYGSSATGADWFGSDLDLRVDARAALYASEACYALRDALEREAWAQRVEARPQARVPVVCFEDARAGVLVDISFGQAETGPLAAFAPRFPADQGDAMLFVKAFLRERGLDRPYTGGLGSFRGGVLLDHFLRKRARRPADFPGSRVASFFRYCVANFNFHRDKVEVAGADGATATVYYGGVDASRLVAALKVALAADGGLASWLDAPALARARDAARAKAAALCAAAAASSASS